MRLQSFPYRFELADPLPRGAHPLAVDYLQALDYTSFTGPAGFCSILEHFPRFLRGHSDWDPSVPIPFLGLNSSLTLLVEGKALGKLVEIK